MKKYIIGIIIAVLVFVGVFLALDKILYPSYIEIITPEVKEQHRFEVGGEAQGTTYSIIYYDTTEVDFQSGIDSIFEMVAKSVSLYDTNSTISRFNNSDSCILADGVILDLFFASDEAYECTNQRFDPSVYAISRVWGFGPDTVAFDSLFAQITDTLLDRDSLLYAWRDSLSGEVLDFVDFDLVTVKGDVTNLLQPVRNPDSSYICKEDSGVLLDFNGIAQGYTIDLIHDYLRNKVGLNNFLIFVGGEISISGEKPKIGPWIAEVERPENKQYAPGNGIAKIKLTKDYRSLSTSGNYKTMKYSGDSIIYGHTINPNTGKPVQTDIISATVLAESCTAADAYSTAFMMMSLEEAIDFIETNPFEFFEGVLVYRNKNRGDSLSMYISSGLKESTIEVDSTYLIHP